MEKKVAAVILIAIASFGCIYGYYNNWFSDVGIPAPGTQLPGDEGTTDESTEQPTNLELGIGTFTVKDVARNALDISTALTIGTNCNHNWYAFRAGGWVLVGASGGTTGTTIELEPQDNGFIYLVSSIPSGQNYYTDAAKTVAMNSRVVSAQFIDVTGDTVAEFVLKYSMTNIPPAASGYPSTTFTGYYLAYDASAAFPTAGQPADQTGIGETQVTKYIAWHFGVSAEKTAIAVYKVEIKVNSTDPAKCSLLNVNIPGLGYVSGTAFDYQKTDTYQIWTYEAGNDLGNCLYWELPANRNNKFDLSTAVQLTLATNDTLTFTMTLYELSGAQATVSDSDAVNMSEA